MSRPNRTWRGTELATQSILDAMQVLQETVARLEQITAMSNITLQEIDAACQLTNQLLSQLIDEVHSIP